MGGVTGTFAAYVLDSDILALLSKGALESLRGCLDFAQQTLALGKTGKVIPLPMSDMGHYILGVVDFPARVHSASLLQWTPLNRAARLMDLMRDGDFRWSEDPEPPTSPSALSFQTPQFFSACKAVILRDAGSGEISDPNKVIMKLHINWGHVSGTQFKRVLVDAEGDTQSLLQHVDGVGSQCDTCKAFDKAPHIPISGTSTVSMFNERLQMDLLFLDDIIAWHIMDVFSKYSFLTRVRPKNPQGVWDAFISSWVGVFGPPKCLHLDEGANGKMISGETCVWNVALNWFSRVRVVIPGFWNDAMAWLVGPITV